MTVTATELYESREYNRTANGKQVIQYFVIDGTADAVVAASAVPDYGDEFTDSPAPRQYVYCVSVKIKRQESMNQCRATVVFESKQADDPDTGQINQEVWDWGFMAAQEKITNIKTQDDRTTYNEENLAGTNPGIGTAINKNGEKVDGASIWVKRRSLRITKYYDPEDADQDWLDMIDDLAATVNDAEWQGYDEGEVLFLGATVREVNDEMTQIDYQFIMNKNIEDQEETILSVSPGSGQVVFNTATVDKEGWQHRGYVHGSVVDKLDKKKYHGIFTINVDTVYDKEDFDQFELTRPNT